MLCVHSRFNSNVLNGENLFWFFFLFFRRLSLQMNWKLQKQILYFILFFFVAFIFSRSQLVNYWTKWIRSIEIVIWRRNMYCMSIHFGYLFCSDSNKWLYKKKTKTKLIDILRRFKSHSVFVFLFSSNSIWLLAHHTNEHEFCKNNTSSSSKNNNTKKKVTNNWNI